MWYGQPYWYNWLYTKLFSDWHDFILYVGICWGIKRNSNLYSPVQRTLLLDHLWHSPYFKTVNMANGLFLPPVYRYFLLNFKLGMLQGNLQKIVMFFHIIIGVDYYDWRIKFRPLNFSKFQQLILTCSWISYRSTRWSITKDKTTELLDIYISA